MGLERSRSQGIPAATCNQALKERALTGGFGGDARELKTELHEMDRDQILAQLARELLAAIPWWHHVELMAKVKSPAAHLYYLHATAQFGWSRNVLLNQIKAKA